MKVGITCGKFDLIHPGYIIMLKEAKSVCDKLIIAIHKEPNGKENPVHTIEERKMILEAIRYVDGVVVYQSEDELRKLLLALKPDIRILGSDWKKGGFDAEDLNIPLYFNSREHDYSCSRLKNKIWEQNNKNLGDNHE